MSAMNDARKHLATRQKHKLGCATIDTAFYAKLLAVADAALATMNVYTPKELQEALRELTEES
jgi:hypothetical protein